MARPFITIIGLGQTGTSLGLALRRQEADFDVVGHDKEPTRNNRAKKAGAVDRTDWNLHNAVEGTDLVVLAIPVAEVAETLMHIGEDLKPGNLVLACVHNMMPAIAAADAHLPKGVHFVAAHPVVTDPDSTSARVDLFEEIVFCLAPSLQTDPGAIGLASDFVERVGAKPLYFDPEEHDGIVAGVEVLPQLLAVAMMRMLSSSPGWAESQRLAGRRFGNVSDTGVSAEQLYASLLSSRSALLTRLDKLQDELADWRKLLSAADPGASVAGASGNGVHGEEEPLLVALQQAVDARLEWEAGVKYNRWNEVDVAPDKVESPGMLRQLFFGNLFSGRRPRDGDDNRSGDGPDAAR